MMPQEVQDRSLDLLTCSPTCMCGCPLNPRTLRKRKYIYYRENVYFDEWCESDMLAQPARIGSFPDAPSQRKCQLYVCKLRDCLGVSAACWSCRHRRFLYAYDIPAILKRASVGTLCIHMATYHALKRHTVQTRPHIYQPASGVGTGAILKFILDLQQLF